MILLKITKEEKPLVLEALHFFGSELEQRLQNCGDNDISERLKDIDLIDRIIDVINLTDKK